MGKINAFHIKTLFLKCYGISLVNEGKFSYTSIPASKCRRNVKIRKINHFTSNGITNSSNKHLWKLKLGNKILTRNWRLFQESQKVTPHPPYTHNTLQLRIRQSICCSISIIKGRANSQNVFPGVMS